MKKTKIKLGISLVSILLTLCMLLGFTFAWFTDTASNTGNRIQAGTLDVDLLMDKTEGRTEDSYVSIAGSTGDIFSSASNANNTNATLWEPGTTHIAYLAVKNNGSLDLKYNIVLDINDKETNNDTSKAMAQSLDFVIVNQSAANDAKITSWDDTNKVNLYTALGSVKSGRVVAAPNGQLQAGDTDYFALVVHMKEEAGNEYQGGEIDIDVNVIATQLTSEADAFDSNQYDKNSTYPALVAFVNETETYSGKFAQNCVVTSSGSSTQVTTKDAIKQADDSSVTLIPKETKLYKANGTEDVAIETTNSASAGYDGDIISSIKTTNATADGITFQISYIYKEGDTETSISKFSSTVSNTFEVSKGLKNVKVYTSHNGGDEVALTSLSTNTDTDGSFYYDSNAGKLYIFK